MQEATRTLMCVKVTTCIGLQKIDLLGVGMQIARNTLPI